MAQPANPIKASWNWLGWLTHRQESATVWIVCVALAVGGWLLSSKWWLGLIIVALAGLLQAAQRAWEKSTESMDDVEKAREKLLESELAPLLTLAASVTSRPRHERRKDVEKAVQQATSGLAHAFGTVQDVRAVVFAVDDSGLNMTPFPPSGRQQRPGDFERGTARGDRAFAVLEMVDPFIIVEDLGKAKPRQWEGSGDGYATFISAPIRSQDDAYGLLTLDAPQVGALDSRHAAMVALFASALGVFFAEAARGG